MKNNEKKESTKVKVLFVCLGNICRSPTAEGVFTHLVKEGGYAEIIDIDSAGTHAYHVGASPDGRAQQAAKNRGIELGHLKGRKAVAADIDHFDYVLAMDHENLTHLKEISTPINVKKIKLFLSYAKEADLDEVPDPYYGGAKGFERVLDLVEEASKGLLAEILRDRV